MPRPRKDRIFGPDIRIPSRAFPSTLASVVFKRWDSICGGSYETPPCPSRIALRTLIETAYLAGSAPDEERFPQFNIVATPVEETGEKQRIGHVWPFDTRRSLTVSELRKLAPAVDLKKSAIWAVWSKSEWQIAGLVDLGTSWHRARMGLEYNYNDPKCLLLQVDRPGRLRVYQGSFHVATLTDGAIEGHEGISLHLSLHEPANRGLDAMAKELKRPKIESYREYYGFEFLALWNTYAAIANSMAQLRHGGALIILPSKSKPSAALTKIKYAQETSILRAAFISCMNARHVIGDLIAESENNQADAEEYPLSPGAELKFRSTFAELIEATRFVAQLSGCDGAILISDDLKLFGFGAEIKAEMRKNCHVYEAVDDYDEMNRKYRRLDLEQFGMRHRSAIKLISHARDARALVISQDGPITAIWKQEDKVIVRKGVNLVNMNMPWA